MKGRLLKILTVFAAILAVFVLTASIVFFSIRELGYRRPYREVVKELGLDESLVYAVMKAESDFREDAVSAAGAVGLMQLMPSTAEYVCRMSGEIFAMERLKDGRYNLRLGCLYLKYLLDRFDEEETALAAYNAGEGIVAGWLKNTEYSEDGKTLKSIPYTETAVYVKKIEKFQKKYRFFYH